MLLQSRNHLRPSVCPAIATLHKILCHGLSRKFCLPAWTPSGAGRHVGRDNFVALTSQGLARNVVGFARSWWGKRIVEILFCAFNTLWRSTPRHVITTALEVHGRSLCAFGPDILILKLFLFPEVVCDYALCRVAHACEFSCVPQAWSSSFTFLSSCADICRKSAFNSKRVFVLLCARTTHVRALCRSRTIFGGPCFVPIIWELIRASCDVFQFL